MKIQLTKPERMAQNGKGLLRLIQNESIPLIDLLIRESFQNSLDATIKGAKNTIIDVGVTTFETEKLSNHLEGLEDVLNYRYSKENPKAIYVSDKNTIGLTGDIRTNDSKLLNKSNIYKLIYGISMNQEESGAGGSWGLGKTSYFRIGNGLVLYYTRVQLKNEKYEERLAVSLIEDSSKKNPLLKDNDRGIAWWGTKDNHNIDLYDNTYPITNTLEIKEILNIFNIDQYVGTETGTTVIIPFVDEEKILPHKTTNGTYRNWWEETIEDSVNVAIQRWYAPRAFNLHYNKKYGSYLDVSVNGKKITVDKMEPLFRIMHTLYTHALIEKSSEKIHVKPIKLARTALSNEGDKIAGHIAFSDYSNKELGMLAPDNSRHPLEYLGYDDSSELEKTNTKIIAYSRKPGMVVEYDINSDWSKGTPSFDDRFIIGFFVPRSNAKLHNQLLGELDTLDDYLRKSEDADHAEWKDVHVNNKPRTLVDRITKTVSKAMETEYGESPEEKNNSRNSALSKKIGSLFLPPTSFGTRSVGPGKKQASLSERESPTNTNISIIEVNVNNEDNLDVFFELFIKPVSYANVSVALKLSSQNYTETKWKKDMGGNSQYPFSIQELYVSEINGEENKSQKKLIIDNKVAINFTAFANLSSFEVENKTAEMLQLKGKIHLKVYDPLIQPSIIVSEVV